MKLKKSFLSLATGLLTVAALASCGGGGTSSGPVISGGKTQLTFFGWGSAAELSIFRDMIIEFENQYPEYSVYYKSADSSTYIQDLGNLKNNRKNMPDVFYMPDINFVQWVNMRDNVMLDLSSYIEKSSKINLNNMFPEGINAYKYDSKTKKMGTGGIYGLPKDLGPNALTYNKSYVTGDCGITIDHSTTSQYGYNPVTKTLYDKVPMTWAQFVRFCQDTTYGDITQTDSIVGVTHYPLESAYYSMGADFTDSTRKNAQINTPEYAEALQFVADLSNRWGAMTTAEGQTSQSGETRFRSGLAASSFIGAWEMPNLWQCDFDWDVLYTPVPNETGHVDPTLYPNAWQEGYRTGCGSKSYLGSVAFSVYKDSACVEGAYKLAEFLATNETAQRINYKKGQAVPNLIDMAKGEFITATLEDGKGMNRPLNREVYVHMMENSPRRPQAFTYNDEWFGQMWECTDNIEYALARVWNPKTTQTYGTHVDVFDWVNHQPINNGFLAGLQSCVQSRLDLYASRYSW